MVNAPATAPVRTWIVDFVLLGAIWGASFLFTRLAVVEFGALPTAAGRVAIASLFLVPLMLMRGLGPQLRCHWKRVLLIGMVNSGLPFACFAFALLYLSTGLSAILNATVPLFGALVAWAWLRDRPDTGRMLGLVVGFVGVALLASDRIGFRGASTGTGSGWLGTWGPALAVGACLLATLCYGIAASYTRLYLQGVPPLVTATGSQLGATLGLALPALAFLPPQMPSLNAWLSLLVAGVVCTGVAYVLHFRLIERAGPARTLTVTFVIPVFAVLYGTLLLDEVITPWMLGCGAVVLLGTALSSGMLRLRKLPG